MARTIMDLFESAEFQSKKLSPGLPDTPPSPAEFEPLLDKFQTNDIYKFGTNYSKIKSDKETLIEQETTGIRFRSAVDINNPLIYGNEAIRITQRSTPLLEDMKSGTVSGGSEAGGGLIGGKINKARDFINSTLGIPETQTPSRLLENKNIQIQNLEKPKSNPFPGIDVPSPPSKTPKAFDEIPSNIPITKDIISKNGTQLGALLKSTGGGNPKTIGKQALGKGIGLAKDKLRGALFGEGQAVGSNDIEPQIATTTNLRKYSDVNFSKTLPSVDGVAKDLEGTKLDLSLVSPIYGVTRPGSAKFGTPEGRFGRTEYAFENKSSDGTRSGFWVNPYAPDRKKTQVTKGTLQDRYGLGKGDVVNKLKPSDYDTVDDNGVYKKGETKVGEDLIPFYIGKFGEKKTPFRAIITGLNESVSPSWSSNKMVGNPFPYYTYNQIERSTSFMLKIYCNSPTELTTNWEKIEALTKMAYPKINQNNLVNPPIIQFRLGDIYFNKTGFIESLNYTIPDNGTWETDGNVGFLPKYIEVSVTIKFIEDSSVLSALYGYKKSKAAVEKIKEDSNSKGFSESNRTGTVEVGQGQFGEFGTDGNFGDGKITVNTRGIVDTSSSPTGENIPNKKSNKLNSLAPKGIAKTQTPIQADSGNGDFVESQSAVVDKLKGKTPLEFVQEIKTNSLTEIQAFLLADFQVAYPSLKKVSLTAIPKDIHKYLKPNNEKAEGAIYLKGTEGNATMYVMIAADGTVNQYVEGEKPEGAPIFNDMFAPGYNRNQLKG